MTLHRRALRKPFTAAIATLLTLITPAICMAELMSTLVIDVPEPGGGNTRLSPVEHVDFETFFDNGNAVLGGKQADIIRVDTASGSSGCEAADFASSVLFRGDIALMARGGCNFSTKVNNAAAAGASAAFIFNDTNDLPAVQLFDVTTIPALFLTEDLGLFLVSRQANGVDIFSWPFALSFQISRVEPTVSVPEPGTLSILALALVGFGFSRRKRGGN